MVVKEIAQRGQKRKQNRPSMSNYENEVRGREKWKENIKGKNQTLCTTV